MEPFEQIWFDFDGTLAVATPEFNKAHDELRYKLYANFLGVSVDDEVRNKYEILYKKHGSNSATFIALGFPATYWMNEFEAANLIRYYQPRVDVSETLKELAKRARLGLFTNNKEWAVRITLKHLGISVGLFDKILTGDMLPNRKPHPNTFKKMLEQADCEASKLLYIGDRYAVDILPIQRLGGKGGIVWSTDERADYSFPEFTDLLEINK